MTTDANVIQLEVPGCSAVSFMFLPGSATTLVRMASAVEPSTILVTRCDETG